MLVKIANNAGINMTGIDSVMVKEKVETEIIKKGGFFTPNTTRKTTSYFVEIWYRDTDGKKAVLNYHCGMDTQFALKLQNEVLSQVKELENVGATQALEEAIKNA
jgi:hypothetical protein